MENPPKKLLDQVRDAIRLKHYSYRTEETYVQWIRRYILFHNKRHPNQMGVPEIEAFLSHLATVDNVAASTQNQAFSALLFLSRPPNPAGRSHRLAPGPPFSLPAYGAHPRRSQRYYRENVRGP
jgi:Phage integrase, N-terminal SAM-like domain